MAKIKMLFVRVIPQASGLDFFVFTAWTPTASLIALALFRLRFGIGEHVPGDHRYVSWPESAAAVPHLFALCKCTTALPFRKWHGETMRAHPRGPHHHDLHRTGLPTPGMSDPGRTKTKPPKLAVLLQPKPICGMHSGSSTISRSTKAGPPMQKRRGSLLLFGSFALRSIPRHQRPHASTSIRSVSTPSNASSKSPGRPLPGRRQGFNP